jgi:uroporphyrinogen-III synthase
MLRVLVTRPEPGASETADRLTARGFEPVVMPLTRTFAVPVTGWDFEADGVAVTSANAVRFAPPQLLQRFRLAPCYCVGERTAETARSAGMERVEAASGDGESLARLIAAKMPEGLRILYLCGQVRRPELEAALASAGFACVTVETYGTVNIEPSAEDLEAAGMADLALVYSPMGAHALARLAARPEAAHLLAKTRFVCLSANVARGLGKLGQNRTSVAAHPNEEELLALLSAP